MIPISRDIVEWMPPKVHKNKNKKYFHDNKILISKVMINIINVSPLVVSSAEVSVVATCDIFVVIDGDGETGKKFDSDGVSVTVEIFDNEGCNSKG